MSFRAIDREVGDVTVIDMDGRITLGEGSALLRDLIARKHLHRAQENRHESGRNQLHRQHGPRRTGQRVPIDKGEGGELKLLNLNKKVTDLLQITKLYTVFDIHNQEAQAIASFHS